jgi:NTP pyrophosphatase (non-canonical NTP hydrolase)
MDDTNTTITDLKNFVEDFVQERDWSQFHNAKNLSMALAIEAGELMDIFKWNTTAECDTMMFEENSRQEAIDELADVLIYAIAFANRNDINISNAIDQKMVKNRKKYPADKFKGHF